MTENADKKISENPEVVEKASRRRFTAEYKRRISLEAERRKQRCQDYLLCCGSSGRFFRARHFKGTLKGRTSIGHRSWRPYAFLGRPRGRSV